MLKIKDNVDLKELIKFGFKNNNEQKSYQYMSDNSDSCIEVFKKSKYITAVDYNPSVGIGEIIVELNILYDLIKADLVEKVSDGNE